jgi:hypothetical protein
MPLPAEAQKPKQDPKETLLKLIQQKYGLSSAVVMKKALQTQDKQVEEAMGQGMTADHIAQSKGMDLGLLDKLVNQGDVKATGEGQPQPQQSQPQQQGKQGNFWYTPFQMNQQTGQITPASILGGLISQHPDDVLKMAQAQTQAYLMPSEIQKNQRMGQQMETTSPEEIDQLNKNAPKGMEIAQSANGKLYWKAKNVRSMGALSQLGIDTEGKTADQVKTEVQNNNPVLYKYLEKVANNELPVRGSFGMSYNQVSEVVSGLFPDKYDPTSYPAKEKLRQDFTSGNASKNIRSLNTATEHLDELNKLIPSLGNGYFMKANSIKNWATRNVGKPGVARFNFVKTALSGELATLFKSSGGTDQEIDNIKQAIDTSDSPANLYDTLQGAVSLMQGRLGALDQQWKTAWGEDKPFPIMSEKTKEIFGRIGGGQSQGQSSVPEVGQMFNGEKVKNVRRIK